MSQQWHTIRATPSRESETSSDDDECKRGGHHFVRNLVTKWQRVCAGSIRDSG
ncbi:MAG: hypothetical protein IJ440_03870 [Alphaproteobacteria bacterium]|nr:hypothetical protein [Alphaproteobacteria bacterium]